MPRYRTISRVRFPGTAARRAARVLDEVGHTPGEFGLWPQLMGAGCLDYLGRLANRRPRRRAELCDRFELSQTELARQSRTRCRPSPIMRTLSWTTRMAPVW
jgi:ABC-type multidrug transport system ATPase subunit